TNPRELVIHDRAGERILEESMKRAAEVMPGGDRILIYKNNTDGKGTSYGTHENYLVDRAVPFARLVHDILPFFVTRQLYCGAGLLGGQSPGKEGTYQISQRADFFEVEVGLETTLKRPIVNTRDEPHADPEKYRRLHVIIGDANMSQVATFLKLGTTAIVLKMIEDEAITEDFSFDNSVQSLRAISHDTQCKDTYKLRDGRTVRAVDVQWAYHEMAQKYFARNDPDPWTAEVMLRWDEMLSGIERDPMTLAGQVDWVAKYRMLDGYRLKNDLAWKDSKLRMMDLQYHDVREDKGLAYLLERGGKLERLVDEDSVQRAMVEPPSDTRAYFRGSCLAKYSKHIAAASWDSVIFDTGQDILQRVPMSEPLRGTREHVAPLLAQCDTAAELVSRLQG
ncbi:MAG: depupylase/deamidase Dop, partial [Actinomycetota bacterium]